MLKNKIYKVLAAAVLTTLSTVQTSAGTSLPQPTTKGFIGLNWTFGASNGAELVLGVAHGQAAFLPGCSSVSGAKAEVRIGLQDGVGLRSARVSGFSGGRDFQAEGGVGYDFTQGDVFFTAGANGDNFAVGGSYGLNGGLGGYAGVHSIGSFCAIR